MSDEDEEQKSSDAKIITWVKGHKILTIGIVVALIVGMVYSLVSSGQNRKAKEEAAKQNNSAVQKMIDAQKSSKTTEDGTDTTLLAAQNALAQRFGQPQKGYILNWDGTLIPKGDKTKTAEQVVYAYLKAISTLDMATAQKYSRSTSIVKDYSSYFDTTTANAASTTTDYQQNIFKQSMLSIQIDSLGDATSFAGNKQTFTANIKMLDLNNTDFLSGGTLNQLESEIDQHGGINSDDTEGAKYLQNWLLKYYASPKAPMTEVSVTLTVQKYPDLNTGWLVSIDKQLDDKFKVEMNQGAYYYVKSDILGLQ